MTFPAHVRRLDRVVLNAADPNGLSQFFVDALGFLPSGRPRHLTLGGTTLEIRPAKPGGRPYPPDVPGWSLLFQHCAFITEDMATAMARLTAVAGWSAISMAGPQRLPAASGGVIAFKFRDPEGHPLELIEPAKGGEAPRPRLDHSAISVRDTTISRDFYERLGLLAGRHSLNIGIEQQRLDAVPGAVVDVTALELPSGTAPHVELLCYRGTFDRRVPEPAPDDIAATRLAFTIAEQSAVTDPCIDLPLCRRDPDGHVLEFEIGD
jgi:catechol 2,3-dioxygenase-like lactoylglutathione lyase family enzyme